jgi:hypothetical protein
MFQPYEFNMMQILLRKPEGRELWSEYHWNFSIYVIFPAATWPYGLLSLIKWVLEELSGGKTLPARKPDNLTAISEPIV